MATTTRWEVCKYALATYLLGRYALNDATQTAITTLSDASLLAGFGAQDLVDVGCEVRLRQDSTAGGGGTVRYDTVRLSRRPSHSAGQMTFSSPVVSGYETPVVANNDSEALVLFRPFRWDNFFAAIDEALRRFPFFKLIVPLTSIPDGDMLASGTTSWSEVGDGEISKVAATHPLGLRVLRMTGVTANDYILSATIPVEPDTSYYLEALGMIASSGAADDTGTLVLRDNTNSADISLDNVTIDRFEPELLINTLTTPSGCKQVAVRLEADNAGDIIDWAHVIFRKNGQLVYPLIDRPQRIVRIGEVRATREQEWGQRSWDTMMPVAADPRQIDAGLWELHLKEDVSGYAVYYEEFVQPAVLDSQSAPDDATVAIPVEDIAAVAVANFLSPYQDMRQWRPAYLRAAMHAGQVVDAYGSQRSYVQSAPKVIPRLRL